MAENPELEHVVLTVLANHLNMNVEELRSEAVREVDEQHTITLRLGDHCGYGYDFLKKR